MSAIAEATERHLAHLDEFVEISMVLARRLRDLPPLIRQDTARDLDLIGRALRRSIRLFHTLASGNLASPPEPGAKPERDPEGPTRPNRDRTGETRHDPTDGLDDISGPFEQTVAAIVHDLQSALATSHGPRAPEPEPTPRPAITLFPADALHPEADTADLN